MHDSFKNLQNYCTEIAANNPAIVFNSQDFTSLSENALSSILTRDDLNIEESEICEKIVEWGVAKFDNNIQTKNVLYWTDENFNAFKKSIERLLPLIRFFNISSFNFYHKVKPFAKILPGTLYEVLLHHYRVPGSHQKSVDAQPLRCSRLNIGSKLLQLHNVKQLDHWIEGKDENTSSENQVRNDFKLLLRGSRDGFAPADFHRLCHNKGATVSIIKVKGTDGKAGNGKLDKFVGTYGPCGGSTHGPSFGQGNIVWYAKDFKSSPGCYCIKTTDYEHVIMPRSENDALDFFFEEYEVFQIMKQ
ncbi:hypothetical protein G9A89_017996 [Geosiphon pyriformis]|nr:hypothetical protein G9A89_017996 [Geosiphon pyriformis]